MKTIEISLFSFSELSEKAQQNVLEKYWNYNVDIEWWDGVYWDAKDSAGLKIKGFDIDRGSYVDAEFTEGAWDSAVSILHNHGETCDTWKEAYDFAAEYKALEKRFQFADEMYYLYNFGKNRLYETNQESECQDRFFKWDEMRIEIEGEMDELESKFLNTLQNEYLSILRNQYEYLTSEQALREYFNDSDLEFRENGTIHH